MLLAVTDASMRANRFHGRPSHGGRAGRHRTPASNSSPNRWPTRRRNPVDNARACRRCRKSTPSRHSPDTIGWIQIAAEHTPSRRHSVCHRAFVHRRPRPDLLDGCTRDHARAFAGEMAREFPAEASQSNPEPIFVRSSEKVWTAAGVHCRHIDTPRPVARRGTTNGDRPFAQRRWPGGLVGAFNLRRPGGSDAVRGRRVWMATCAKAGADPRRAKSPSSPNLVARTVFRPGRPAPR